MGTCLVVVALVPVVEALLQQLVLAGQLLGRERLGGVDALLLGGPRLLLVGAVRLGDLVALLAAEQVQLTVKDVEQLLGEELELIRALVAGRPRCLLEMVRRERRSETPSA